MPDGQKNRRIMIVLAYLWLLAFVPPLVERDAPHMQWRHGLVLMVTELVLLFASVVTSSLVSLGTLGLGFVLGLLFVCARIGILGLHVVAIIKSMSGGHLAVPVLGTCAGRF